MADNPKKDGTLILDYWECNDLCDDMELLSLQIITKNHNVNVCGWRGALDCQFESIANAKAFLLELNKLISNKPEARMRGNEMETWFTLMEDDEPTIDKAIQATKDSEFQMTHQLFIEIKGLIDKYAYKEPAA